MASVSLIRITTIRVLIGAFFLAAALDTGAQSESETSREPSTAATSKSGASSGVADLEAGAAVEIQAALGFSGAYRLGAWAPISVTLENRRASVSGHLEVRVPDGDELGGRAFVNIHRQSVDLPRGSRKRFYFSIYLKSFSQPVEIKLFSGDSEIGHKSVDLRTGVTNARIVLVLGRNADLDYLNDARGRRLRVLYPRVERLPEHWAGYDGVAALVLHGLSLEGLSSRQHSALIKWLASGGILAASGGPDYGLLRTPRLAMLLPGLPLGLVSLPDGEAAGIAFGAPLPARRPFHVNLVPQFEGRVLYRAGKTPLVIERSFGRGRVLYVTFDITRHPFDAWPGMAGLWHTLLDLPPPEPLSARLMRTEESSALPGLIKIAPLSFPGHPVLLVFITLYLGCMAVAFHHRSERRHGRRIPMRLHWVAPLVFAPAAFFLFGPLLFSPGPVAVVAARIAPHPQGPLADLGFEVGMFSNADDPLRIDYRAPEPVFRPDYQAPPRKITANWEYREAPSGGSLAPTTRGRYLLHILEGRDVIAWDLHAALVEEPDKVRLEVRNRSGRVLHDLWLVLDGRGYPLDPVPAEGNATRLLDPKRDAVPLREHSWRKLLASRSDAPLSQSGAMAHLIDRELARLRERDAPSAHEAILVGFSRSPLRLAGPSAHWRRHEFALVLLRVPIERRVRDRGGFRS